MVILKNKSGDEKTNDTNFQCLVPLPLTSQHLPVSYNEI